MTYSVLKVPLNPNQPTNCVSWRVDTVSCMLLLRRTALCEAWETCPSWLCLLTSWLCVLTSWHCLVCFYYDELRCVRFEKQVRLDCVYWRVDTVSCMLLLRWTALHEAWEAGPSWLCLLTSWHCVLTSWHCLVCFYYDELRCMRLEKQVRLDCVSWRLDTVSCMLLLRRTALYEAWEAGLSWLCLLTSWHCVLYASTTMNCAAWGLRSRSVLTHVS